MRKGLYPHLAFSSMGKNKRMYVPYLLTCTGMIMMNYIITFLALSDNLSNMRGGDQIKTMLGLGCYVMAVFAVIFLFYTNSFLIKRRKKELGLYNILGMGKRNIACILLWETIITAAVSLAAGIAGGVLFSKLAELVAVNLLEGSIDYDFSVSAAAIMETTVLFGVIFVLILLNSIRQVHLANPVVLLKSENMGEKPPKGNWIIGILGILILAAAYYIAVTITNPLAAFVWFFVAVIMVIVATNMLFISGSVLVCRILKRKKGYYYKASHFISVSSMSYRMKRNGAGLASICILATMVLVMVTGSACLFFGSEDSLNTRYPQEICINVSFNERNEENIEITDEIKSRVESVLNENGTEACYMADYDVSVIEGYLEGTTFDPDVYVSNSMGYEEMNNIYVAYFISEDGYATMTGHDINLGPDQAIIYTGERTYSGDSITFKGGKTYDIVKKLDKFPYNGDMAMTVVAPLIVVVDDIGSAVSPYEGIKSRGYNVVTNKWYLGVDTGLDHASQMKINESINDALSSVSVKYEKEIQYARSESREENRETFYGIYGGIFFLGILLSIVFISATALMIYYKQISEGYEDQSRFDTMKKVGMTEKNIKSSIRSQMLTVFFLPLAMAIIHLAFAFPMIRQLLIIFSLKNTALLIGVAGICVLVFALLYGFVYKMTSRIYYKIVNGV